MKNKDVPFNYKVFRIAAVLFWLIFVAGMIFNEYAFYIGGAAIFITLGITAIGFIYEMKGWFKKA